MTVAAVSASSDFLAQLQPGRKLAGCYLLQRSVEGGSLPIWLAHDEVLGKDISLEFLPTGILGRAGAADRLRQEVKRARQLIHPRILRVYDLVEEDSWAAVAMDTFTTQPLTSVIASHQRHFFETAEVWPVARELCETLAEAHRIRIPHGGLSMKEVLVGGGSLKLMNFGITACLHELAPELVTLPFASPQQLAGERPTISDDVYAVGALLHTLLVGAPPFTGNERPERAPTASAHRRDVGGAGAEVPQAWEETIAACLQSDPAARPVSCADIAARLEQGIAGRAENPVPAAAVPSLSTAPVGAAQESAPESASTAAVATTAVAAGPSLEAPEAAKASIAEPPEGTVAPAAEAGAEAPTTVAESAPSAAEPAAPVAERESGEPPKPAEESGKEVQAAPVGAEVPKKAEAGEPVSTGAPEATEGVADVGARSNRPTRRVKPTGRTGREVPVVDEAELAETVRREELASDASSSRREADDDEPFGHRAEGPSLLTLAVVGGVIVLLGFVMYRVFFGESQQTPSVGSTPRMAEATPAAATPGGRGIIEATPAPKALSTPEKMASGTTPPPSAATAIVPRESPVPSGKADSSSAPTVSEGPAVRPSAAAAPEQLEAAVADLKRTIETTSNELPNVGKSEDEIGSEQKKLEETASKAELAARDAEKAAAEKKKTAEEARKAASAASEKLAAHRAETAKREAELARMRSELAEKERALTEAKKAAPPVGSASKTAAKAPSPGPGTGATSGTAPGAPLADAHSASTPSDARSAFEQKMKELGTVLSGRATPAAKVGPSPAAGAKTEATELAKATTPKPADLATPGAKATGKAASATAGDGFTNSLGMKFVPMPDGDGLICIWPTRVRDFEIFAKAAGLRSSLWKDPGFKQGPDHPVVNVTWQEAMAFCKWLTGEEQKKGLISAKQSYRLPTDIEWSRAAGLANEKGATPESRDMSVADVYPWGTTWPPPSGAGNYTGEETGSDVAIKGYNDGFPWTSPVGSFPPNKLGLYDMGGNVWQWCMDSWNAESKAKVLRGASWYNGALKLSLLTSCRVHASPDSSTDNYGFRVFLAGSLTNTSKK